MEVGDAEGGGAEMVGEDGGVWEGVIKANGVLGVGVDDALCR